MFSRLANLFKGFFSLFISGVERRNPEALLELEQENLRKQIANFNQGLATHAGLCERIMGQVRKLEAEQKDLRAKTTAHLRAGNKSAAGQYALRLQTIDAQLEENRKQLEQAEATYKNLVKARDVAVQTARAKIECLKGAINDMRMNQAMAEIHEMASGMISSIGGAGDTLNRLHEMVEEERTKAAGRARIAKDSIDMTGVEVQGSRAHRARRPGAGRFRRARGHLDPGRSARACAAHAGRDGESEQPGQLKCPHLRARRPGRASWRSPTKAALTVSSFSTATCTTASPSAAAWSISPATSRTICSPAFRVVLSYDLGNGLTIERGGELVEKWGGANLKALPREPLPAIQYISRYLRYLGNLRALGREVKENVAVILRGVDRRRAGRRRGLRTRQPHERAARLGVGSAVQRSAVHEHSDRRQSQRRRAADRLQRARVAHSRAAAGCAGAGARAGPPQGAGAESVRRRCQSAAARGCARRRHGRRRSKAW